MSEWNIYMIDKSSESQAGTKMCTNGFVWVHSMIMWACKVKLQSKKKPVGECDVSRYWCDYRREEECWAWEGRTGGTETGWTVLASGWQHTFLTWYLSGRLNVFVAGFENRKKPIKCIEEQLNHCMNKSRCWSLHYVDLRQTLVVVLSSVSLPLKSFHSHEFACRPVIHQDLLSNILGWLVLPNMVI